MKNLYPGGVEELLSGQMRDDNNPSLPTDPETDYPVMALKKKKQSAILKDILNQGGYRDLARQVSIRHKE